MTLESIKPKKMAFVTLVTTDSYAIGAQVLGRSLRKVNSRYHLICLVTNNLSPSTLQELHNSDTSCIDEVRIVEPIDSKDKNNLELLGRPELGCTFTKLQVWKQIDLEKVLFLDSDMLVVENIDDLFEREEISACPDAGWPDCFNSGLFVCRPNIDTFLALLSHADSHGSFDGGDQGLLNSYFADWSKGDSSRRIPFGYNLTINASYSYLPAFKHFRNEVKVVHFIGYNKPWTFHRFVDGKVIPHGQQSQDHLKFVQMWWDHYDDLKNNFSAYVAASNTTANVFQASQMKFMSGSYSENSGHIPFKAFEGQSFGNYKISWSNDVEDYFKNMKVDNRQSQPDTVGKVLDCRNAKTDIDI